MTNPTMSLAQAGAIRMPFGKHKGLKLTDIDDDYLNWVSRQEEMKPDLRQGAKVVLEGRKSAEKRLSGAEGTATTYIIERLGDISGVTEHESLNAALAQLCVEYPVRTEEECQNFEEPGRQTPDPEDDRILIWEVLLSGHKKVVWHFSGWHWDVDEFDIPQGCLPGDAQCLYWIACS